MADSENWQRITSSDASMACDDHLKTKNNLLMNLFTILSLLSLQYWTVESLIKLHSRERSQNWFSGAEQTFWLTESVWLVWFRFADLLFQQIHVTRFSWKICKKSMTQTHPPLQRSFHRSECYPLSPAFLVCSSDSDPSCIRWSISPEHPWCTVTIS